MNLIIEENKITPNAVIGGILGESARISLKVCLDLSWQKYSAKIVFATPSGKRITRRLGKKEISIPDAVMAERGKTHFVIVGKRGKKIRVSTCGMIIVLGDTEEPSETGGAVYGE